MAMNGQISTYGQNGFSLAKRYKKMARFVKSGHEIAKLATLPYGFLVRLKSYPMLLCRL
jgi:hypothetical protein